jgi:uncharacterized protein with PQ loop repeat
VAGECSVAVDPVMKAFIIVEIFALLFWSFQLAPQTIENWKRQTTIGLSPNMMLLWSLGSLCTGIYCVGGGFEVLFIIQPNLFMVFSILCYAQCFYYDYGERAGILIGVLFTSFIVICEVLGGYFLKQRMINSTFSGSTSYWPFDLLGACSTLFFGIGYALQFYTISRTGYVEGISLPFLAIDTTGAALSIAALLLPGQDFQPVSITCYIMTLVCDLTIVIMSTRMKPPNAASPSASPHAENADASPKRSSAPNTDASTQDTKRFSEECKDAYEDFV